MTRASPVPVLSCSDSDSEAGPTGTQSSTSHAPVLEAASPSVVSLAGPVAPPPTVGSDPPKLFIPTSDSFINSLVSDRDKASAPQASITEEAEELSPAPVLPTPDPTGHEVPWMNVDLEGAESARGGQEASGSPADGGAAASYALGTLETSRVAGESDGPVWTWISGGGCEVDADSQISWLSPTGTCRTSRQEVLTAAAEEAWSRSSFCVFVWSGRVPVACLRFPSGRDPPHLCGGVS